MEVCIFIGHGNYHVAWVEWLTHNGISPDVEICSLIAVFCAAKCLDMLQYFLFLAT